MAMEGIYRTGGSDLCLILSAVYLAVHVGSLSAAQARSVGSFESRKEPIVTPVAAAVSTNKPAEPSTTFKADKFSRDGAAGLIEGIGHVIITKGDDQLRADYVKFFEETEVAEAVGNVVLYKLMFQNVTNAPSVNAAGQVVMPMSKPGAVESVVVWSGEKLRYNFKKREGWATNMVYNFAPFFIRSNSGKQEGKEYNLRDTTVTTCTNTFPHCHYHVRAREVNVVQGESMKARSSWFYFGGIPVFYLPYWTKNLDDDFGFRFYPGYNSRMGAFLKTLYRFQLNPYIKSVTHLDYRSQRGVAFGQDFVWAHTGSNSWSGEISGYYLSDDDPTEDGRRAEEDVDSSRYRVSLRHTQNFSSRDYLLAQAQYLSDPYLNMDFFEDAYREANQPDNYLTFTHRGDMYTANLLTRSRLNDFYTTVNRIPEVSLDFMRRELGDTVFYYDGKTAAAFLQKSYEKSNTNDQDYSAFRLDSLHMFYYPERFFGFLNVMPRAGYRATYYSETMTESAMVTTGMTTVATTTVDASGSTNTVYSNVLTTNNVTSRAKGPAKLRSRFEIGAETSFRAFRTWDDEFGGWRHVVEPYANYTMVPEPNLLPENIYQFDEVDTYGKEHWVKLGVRNKLQTKLGGFPFDVIDFDVFTRYLFEKGDRDSSIDNIYFELKTWPTEGLTMFFDSTYDTEVSELSTFNTRLSYASTNAYTISIEHRYRNQESSLLNAGLSYAPNWFWLFELYGRYEFETSRLEEEWLYISKKTDCLTFRTGVGLRPGYTMDNGFEEEDEWRFVVELWLNAFPDMAMGNNRHSN